MESVPAREQSTKPPDVAEHLAAGGDLPLKGEPYQAPPASKQRAADDTSADTVPITAHADLPVFPVEVLPAVLGEWVAAEAEAMQTPIDLPAFCALGASAALVQRAVRHVEVRPGWHEPPGLYLFTGLVPGARKSPVYAHAMAPLGEIEAALRETHGAAIAEAHSFRRAAEARQRAAEQNHAKQQTTETEAELRDATKKLEELALPPVTELHFGDLTPEGLANALVAHGGTLTIMSSEGGVIVDMAGGRYGDVANVDLALKGHAGEGVRIVRASRPIRTIDEVRLNVCVTAQPEVLADFAKLEFRGWPDRWLYSLPADGLGRRRDDGRPLPDRVRDRYHKLLKEIGEKGVADNAQRRVLVFDEDARAEIVRLHNALEPRIGGDLRWISGWASKLRGALARLACLFHVVEAIDRGGDPWAPITGTTARRAFRLADYFIAHAQAARALMRGRPDERDGGRILAAVRADAARRPKPLEVETVKLPTGEDRLLKLPTGEVVISARGILRLCRGMGADERDKALEVLEQFGHTRRHEVEEPRRGRPSPKYAFRLEDTRAQ